VNQRSDIHSFPEGSDAAFHGQTIDEYGALGALPVSTKNPLRRIIHYVAGKGTDAVGEKGRGHHFPFSAHKGLTVKGKGDVSAWFLV
jgi:hypothetical protein